MTIDELNERFGISGALAFEATGSGLARAKVTTPACTAELYLQGAHLALWQPAGAEPVLFLSEATKLEKGVAIRGGIPVIFPWFGARTATPESPRTDGPSHGFARITEWEVSFAAVVGEDLHLALSLVPDDNARTLGFDHFRVALQFTLGRTLAVKMTVANENSEPLRFEEALHTYLHVGDATQVAVRGLQGTEFLDKPDGYKRKTQAEEPLHFERETDRVYLNTEATVHIDDPVLKRTLVVEKSGSHTTVVWNPWSELSHKLVDMTDDGWRSMVCVETANAAEGAVVLEPRSLHTMEARFRVEPLQS
jgi:glucose-6-phosphate 1-epimerase